MNRCPACGARFGGRDSGPAVCEFCGSALVPVETTVGAVCFSWAARFRTLIRCVLAIGSFGLGMYFLKGRYWSTWGSPSTEMIAWPAILIGIAVLLLSAGRFKPVAIGISALTGVALILKPVLLPLRSEWMGQVFAFSYTSETHLNFVVPGVLFVVLAVIIAATLKVRRRG